MSRSLRLPVALALIVLAFAVPLGLRSFVESDGEARKPITARSLPVAATPAPEPTPAAGTVTLALSRTAPLPALNDPRSPAPRSPAPRRQRPARVTVPRAPVAPAPTVVAPQSPPVAVATPAPIQPPVSTPAPDPDDSGSFDTTGEP